MSYEQAKTCPFNPFDLTKIWSHKDYPLIEVGKLVFNRNPKNYFAEVEQLSFSPAALVPGIEASPDKMLQVGGDYCRLENDFVKFRFSTTGSPVLLRRHRKVQAGTKLQADPRQLPLQVGVPI